MVDDFNGQNQQDFSNAQLAAAQQLASAHSATLDGCMWRIGLRSTDSTLKSWTKPL